MARKAKATKKKTKKTKKKASQRQTRVDKYHKESVEFDWSPSLDEPVSVAAAQALWLKGRMKKY